MVCEATLTQGKMIHPVSETGHRIFVYTKYNILLLSQFLHYFLTTENAFLPILNSKCEKHVTKSKIAKMIYALNFEIKPNSFFF